MQTRSSSSIAIIGMAGRFPDAPDVQAFWRNLERGHESLTTFSEAELLESGVPPVLIARPEFVRKGSMIEGTDLFDAGFFGFNPREAEIIDPQQRVLLECAWEAMEDSGYGGGDKKNVGVYAGASMNSYVWNLLSHPDLVENAGLYQLMISSDKDFLASRIGYKLDFRGPCITVQTACSTSLVAVHVAAQALLAGECEMALAGGVSLRFPQKTGYLFQEGMIFSPDGHCRPFDAGGRGIHGGEGVGLVVLKRLEDARRDRDPIRGVILGTAINNDGAGKIGYTAPSVEGQAEVLSAALAASGVDPASIGYIEAHGTATPLGDTIEFAGLSKVYGGSEVPCAIGAVKSNIGHLDVAAGVAGLIKTLLVLEHRSIPPTLHFQQPNPELHWGNSRFYINTSTQNWLEGPAPRRAAVSSFGIGGTNAHVVLEEAPPEKESQSVWPQQLLVVSAVTATALNAVIHRLASHLESQPEACVADLCYTLQGGRKQFPHRRALVCSSLRQLRDALKEPFPKEFAGAVLDAANPPLAFMFTGQGAQYQGMARDLYAFQPTFRRELDLCAGLLQEELGLDVRDLLYGSRSAAELNETRIAQPILFALEFALARMWMRFGVAPGAMIGHSVGEFVAACLAGVFTLEDALRVVAFRGRVMQSMPRGSMLSVGLGEEQLPAMIGGGSISVAAVNGRSLCTVSGPEEEIADLQSRLEEKQIPCSRLHTSHAFHSSMMEPAVQQFREFLRGVPLHRPAIPFISNVTGDWITAEDAVDPDYWAAHLRAKVQFAKGVRKLAVSSGSVLLEVGPGHTLTVLARECQSSGSSGGAFSSLPHAKDPQPAASLALSTLGALWLRGVAIDWQAVHEGESLHRMSLPAYPFERSRFFVKPALPEVFDRKPYPSSGRLDFEDWFHVPTWKRTVLPAEETGKNLGPWLVFADTAGLADAVFPALSARGEEWVRVNAGSAFSFDGDRSYTIDPGSMEEYRKLLGDLIRKRQAPRSVLFCWGLQSAKESFHHLIRLAQAFGEQGHSDPVEIVAVSAGMHKVHGDEALDPESALLFGPCKTIPVEYPNLQCRTVDLCAEEGFEDAVALLCAEPGIPTPLDGVAYRRGYRWEQSFEAIHLPAAEDRIRAGGVYLITGGMGGIGLTLARYLASFRARLALIGRSPTPAREEWQSWLDTHSPEDRVSARIRELRELERLGAEVLPLAADVANADEMRRAIDRVHEQLGPIEGIVHAAGIAGGGLIQIKATAAAERVLAPKVDGTRNLQSLTARDPVGFFVLCSSVNSIVGMIGGVDYTAANAYLDVCAAAANGHGPAVMMSIDWDAWQEVGMAVNTQVPREMQAARLASLETAIRPAEGVEVFRRILAARLPQVSVVTRDVLRGSKRTAEPAAPPELPEKEAGLASSHARPDLPTAFQAPETEVERTVAKIWQEALGQSWVGLDDNFFDLGGHSLVATSILSRVRNAFNISLPLRVIFETPTVRSLSEHVETLMWNVSHHPAAEDSGQREEVEI